MYCERTIDRKADIKSIAKRQCLETAIATYKIRGIESALSAQLPAQIEIRFPQEIPYI